MRQTAAWNKTICKHNVPRINEVFSHRVNNRENLRGIGKGGKAYGFGWHFNRDEEKWHRKLFYYYFSNCFRIRPGELTMPEAAPY